jgi:DNA-binding MarR family transcriptional regulator
MQMKKDDSRQNASAVPRARLGAPLVDDIESAWLTERPDLDLSFTTTLLRIERAYYLQKARLHAIAKRSGLQTGELYVLLALRRSGKPYELRPTDLFRALFVTSGAMTGRVARLQERGLTMRVSANDDGRSELVRLTAKGLATADRAIADIARVVQRMKIEGGLTDQEIAMLDRLMRKLLSALPMRHSKESKSHVSKRRGSQGDRTP